MIENSFLDYVILTFLAVCILIAVYKILQIAIGSILIFIQNKKKRIKPNANMVVYHYVDNYGIEIRSKDAHDDGDDIRMMNGATANINNIGSII